MRVENAQSADLVFVVSKQGRPLMPCKPAIARRLLCQGKAKVIRRVSFTIQLIYGATGYIQEVEGAMDSGSKTIGCAAIANGKVLYQSEVQLRTDVSSKIE